MMLSFSRMLFGSFQRMLFPLTVCGHSYVAILCHLRPRDRGDAPLERQADLLEDADALLHGGQGLARLRDGGDARVERLDALKEGEVELVEAVEFVLLDLDREGEPAVALLCVADQALELLRLEDRAAGRLARPPRALGGGGGGGAPSG